MTIIQYHEQFFHLVKYIPQYQNDDLFRTHKFIMGLCPKISNEVEMYESYSMHYALSKALKKEQRLKDMAPMKSSRNQGFKRRFGDDKYGIGECSSNWNRRDEASH